MSQNVIFSNLAWPKNPDMLVFQKEKPLRGAPQHRGAFENLCRSIQRYPASRDHARSILSDNESERACVCVRARVRALEDARASVRVFTRAFARVVQASNTRT